MRKICETIMTNIAVTMDLIPQVLGVIDVTRSKEKGYQTLVKDGFCSEVIFRNCFRSGCHISDFSSSNSFLVFTSWMS